jgi:hypothetical protein
MNDNAQMGGLGNVPMEQVLEAFGATDDAAAVLAQQIANHMGSRISDLALPSLLFIYRWSVTLGAPELRLFADYLQRIVAQAHEPKDSVKAMEALSLHDFLKGVQIMGGK